MDKVDFVTIVREARDLLGGENEEYSNGVIDLAASLLFPDIPLGVAVELTYAAISSKNW